MANNTKHIHEIEPELASSEIDGTEVLVVSNPNGTGYDTNKVSIGSLAEFARGGANTNGITLEQIFNRIYPVGSIYTTIDSAFDPGTAFGGEWEVIGDGRCLYGCSKTSSSVGQEISSSLPKLTISNTTSSVDMYQTQVTANTWTTNPCGGGNNRVGQLTLTSSGTITASGKDGSVQCGTDLDVRPPSIGVIFWKRTA